MGLFHTEVAARQCAVVYHRGEFRKVLPAGRHRVRRGDQLVPVDLRERLLTLAPQEVATADAVTVRVSAAIRWAVTDARLFLESAEQPEAVLYLAAQIVLRDAVAPLTVEQLAARTPVDPSELTDALSGAAAGIGVRAELVLRDVILPSALRDAALEVMTARHRGAAKLEQARAETAALRSLANGARLLDESPGLQRLRLVQEAGYGSQLVLHLGGETDAD